MFNWREVPFVRLLLPFATGIGLAFYFDQNLPFLLLVLFILLFIIAWLSAKKLSPSLRAYYSAFVHLFLLAFGYQLAFQQNTFHKEDHFRHVLSTENIGIGTVQNVAKSGKFDRATVQIEQMGTTTGQAQNTSGQVLLLLNKSEGDKAVLYGDRIAFKAKITPATAPKNPNAFDYRHILRIKGIYHQAFIKNENWERLEADQSSPFMAKTFALREHLITVLRKHLPGDNEFAVGGAMLLGDKSAIQDEVKNAYAGTGATHVMAVSGLHLGIIFLGIGTLLKLIKTRNRFFRIIKPTIMIAGIWGFALLTGASPSAMRAAVMFSFLIVGQSLVRFVNIYNTLAISAFALLCYNPYLLFETGFQLSYLAVIGIVFFQPKIYRLWIIDHKVGDYLWSLASVGLAAQLTTFPLSLFYFNQFPVYFWLSGLVVVPAAFLIICVGVLLFFMEAIFPAGAIWVGKLLYGIIWLMNAIVFMIRQLPAGLIEGVWVGLGVFLLLYLCVIAISVAINTEQIKWVLYGFTALTLVSGSYAFTTISQVKQQQIVLYHTSKNTLIDFVDGQQVISIHNAALSEKTETYAAQRNRWALGIDKINHFIMEENEVIERSNFKHQNRVIQFHNTHLALVNDLPFSSRKLDLELDHLILYDNPVLSMKQLKSFYNFKSIWFASSNSTYKTKAWENECVALNIPYRTVGSEGAIIQNLTLKE